MAEGFSYPNGLALTSDQAWLYVADGRSRFVHSFEARPDGSLASGQRFCHLHLGDDDPDSGADGLSVDVTGRLYVATRLGLQFCDQAGRVNGIIERPPGRWLTQAIFGGPGMSALYASSGDAVYRRATKTRGVIPAEVPIKPPQPRL